MIEKIKFIVSESFKSFKRYPLYSFISSLTIAICLLLISFIIYLSNVSNNISENFKSNESVIDIFIANSFNNEDAKKICSDIGNSSKIKKINFFNKQNLLSKIKIESNLMQWMDNDIDFIPCVCSATIDIKYVSDINQISNDISNKYGDKLIKVVYPESYLIKFEKIISTIYTFIFVIGIVVLVVSIFNVSNIIKLSLESRKDIITTLKLHGANKIFIRAPFIIEGIMQGLLGSIISSIIILLIFNLGYLDSYNHFLIYSFISTISMTMYIFLNIMFGILLGFIGSNLGTSSYLD